MKKVISILIIATLFAAIACASVSAEIRFYDPFDTWTSYWIGYGDPNQGGDLNFLSKFNGENVLEGWEEAVVHQGDYSDNDVLGKGYKNSGSALITGTFWVDLRVEDLGNDGSAGLWWKNTYHETHEDAESADTYTLFYYPATSTVKFLRDYPGAETDDERLVKEWQDPKNRGSNINGEKIVLGMRVESGKISAFVDGEWIATYNDSTIGVDPCPILLWNNGLHTIWDNFYVGDLAELPLPGSNNGGNQDNNEPEETETEKRIETKVVHETNEAGEDVTVIVTEEVVVPVANTGRTSTGTRSSSKTGDTAIIVVAVMVVALGAAIVVKKVTTK